MITHKPWLTIIGRTTIIPQRRRWKFVPLLFQLEAHEAAGSLLNPLLPDPFLALIDLPLSGTMAPKAEPDSAQGGRWLTKHDTWLTPQFPLADEPTIRASYGPNTIDVTAAPRPELEAESFGQLIRPAVFNVANELSVREAVATVGGSQHFVPVALPAANDVLGAGLGSRWPAMMADATVNYDTLDEPIPNMAPTATNDSITVPEDGSVVFDPTLNDTDPDTGDKLWVQTVQGETDFGRTYLEEGGSIRYIPNPNYENTSGHQGYTKDSFTYTVTDGVDESTATVTVASVNDAPIAANDVGVFTNPALQYPQGFPDEITYPVQDVRSVFVNDRDYDANTGVSFYDSKFTDLKGVPTKGKVTIHTDGTFLWSGPRACAL